MEGTRASDEVIDEIAHIAMLRQDAERHGGAGSGASSEALRKLNELRDREQKALQTAEDKSVHQANLEALANEIRKVQHLSGGGGNRNGGDRNARPRPQQQQQPRKEGGGGGGGGGGRPHGQSRNKGRRNSGRPGGPGGQGGQGGQP
jgi:hypothetical protein